MGKRHACTHGRHLGASLHGSKSCLSPCHQQSTRAARAGSGVRTVCLAAGRAGRRYTTRWDGQATAPGFRAIGPAFPAVDW